MEANCNFLAVSSQLYAIVIAFVRLVNMEKDFPDFQTHFSLFPSHQYRNPTKIFNYIQTLICFFCFTDFRLHFSGGNDNGGLNHPHQTDENWRTVMENWIRISIAGYRFSVHHAKSENAPKTHGITSNKMEWENEKI